MKTESDEYSDVKIGDRSIESSRLGLAGPITTGDFGSGLLSIFREENAAMFHFDKQSPDRRIESTRSTSEFH